MIEILEKLAAANIQLIPADVTSHFIFERDGFVAFVERREDAFGNIGAPGLMTERGFAALIWRGDQAGSDPFPANRAAVYQHHRQCRDTKPQAEENKCLTAMIAFACSHPWFTDLRSNEPKIVNIRSPKGKKSHLRLKSELRLPSRSSSAG